MTDKKPKTLAELREEKKKLLAEAEMKGATGGKAVGPDEDGGMSKPALGGTVKPVSRDDGTKDAPKDFEPKNGELGNTKSVNREAGSAPGRKEVGDGDKEGNKSAVEGAKPVGREEGSAGGPKDWEGSLDSFNKKMREVLGLPLNSELNQGNKGLNKKS